MVLTRHKQDTSRHQHLPLVALTADVGHALTTCHMLKDMLQGCVQALVGHLDVVVARVWTVNSAHSAPMLQASAGLSSLAEDGSRPTAVDRSILDRIVQARAPLLTDSLEGKPHADDQAGAAQKKRTAFAGYPLIVEDHLVGVLALFSHQPLSPIVLQVVESVADQIAVGVERSRAAQALQASEERYRAAFANAAVGVTLADLQDRCLEANAAFCTLTGYSEDELLHKDFPSLTYPDDRADSLALMARLRSGELPSIIMEKRYVRKDGSIVWVQNSVALVRDADGSAITTIALTEDISKRKQAEAEREEAAARQRTFARDVLASVTEGRLLLCNHADELPPPRKKVLLPFALTPTGGLAELRRAVMAAAREAGYAEERVGDLVIAVSEAGMNAIVHAQTGTATVSLGEEGTVQVRVEDHGLGITLENLPKATLARGFSTASTLGHGLKMMLETVDHLYLLTSTDGTTVVIEQDRERPLPVLL